ncbi:MAG: ZIP family metal transporter [Saezia sp.]
MLILIGFVAWRYFRISQPSVAAALIGGSLAALATAAGTLPLLFSRYLSERIQDGMLGFGAGVMLAACSFSLIIPGIDAATEQGFGRWGAPLIIAASILLGTAAMFMMEFLAPHEHFIAGVDTEKNRTIRRTWLFIFAIALHNVPEGLAIGVAFGGNNTMQASALAAGISIQDIPEGMVVAVALFGAGYKRSHAVLIGVASGMVEPIGAVIGALIVNVSSTLLPWGLGISAGAMLFVISHEMIPESHRKGHESSATAGLILGFVLMMLLDVALG